MPVFTFSYTIHPLPSMRLAKASLLTCALSHCVPALSVARDRMDSTLWRVSYSLVNQCDETDKAFP